MLKQSGILALLAIVLPCRPAIADPAVPNDLVCYVQTASGRTLNLGALCGTTDRASAEVEPDPNVTVSQLSYDGHTLTGQVVNQTGEPVRSVIVNYAIIDRSGHEIDAGAVKTQSGVAPGETANFHQVNSHSDATVKVIAIDWVY